MWTVRSLALLAAVGVANGLIADMDACRAECYTNIKNQAGQYACGADDMACLCANEGWGWAIHDCAKNSCEAGLKPTIVGEVSSVCQAGGFAFAAAAALAANDATAAPTPTPSPTVTPPAEQPTTAAQTPATTEVLPESTSTELPSSTTLETSTTAPATATEASHTSSATHSSSPSGTAAESEATSEAPIDSAAPPAGLPEAAKIGIGVGVGAAVLALIGVGICIFLRNRHVTKEPESITDRYKISPPMPSREQHPYMHNNSSSEYDLGSAELKGTRYDDLTEGQQPRQMV